MKPAVIASDPVITTKPPTTNKHLIRWVEKMAELCRPDSIHWVDGSKREYDEICDLLIEKGTFVRLDKKRWPGMLLCPLCAERRCARRRSYLYLFLLAYSSGAYQQLGRSIRDAEEAQAALSRVDAG